MNTTIFVERSAATLLDGRGLRPDGRFDTIADADSELFAYTVDNEQLVVLERDLSDAGLSMHRGDQAVLTPSLSGWTAALAGQLALDFLRTAATSMGRGSFYNTKAEQDAAEAVVHDALFSLDRGLYAALLSLPGATDRSRQLGIVRLLSTPLSVKPSVFVDTGSEMKLVGSMLDGMSVPRRLKTFGLLKSQRVNNARTRKLILRTILGSRSLQMWVVRYRVKVRAALQHALGKRTASIVCSILCKPIANWDSTETDIIQSKLGRYAGERPLTELAELVGFALGLESDLLGKGPALRLPKAYVEAKTTFEAGSVLPYETMEGLRGTYHADKTSADVLALTKRQLTSSQKLGMQAKAEKSKVKIDFNPAKQDPVKLYIHAFERGMTPEIEAALDAKAAVLASVIPLSFDRIAIVLDASQSMWGSDTQALRPISTALVLRDMLHEITSNSRVFITGGIVTDRLVLPESDTSLATALVEALQTEPDHVFVLTDGYENAPAGRVDDVMNAVRGMGITTPVTQVTPVFAAETKGTRALSSEIPVLSVTQPAGLLTELMRGLLKSDPGRGLTALVTSALS